MRLVNSKFESHFAPSQGEVSHGSIAEGNTSGSHNFTMTFETQIHLLLLPELAEGKKKWLWGLAGSCGIRKEISDIFVVFLGTNAVTVESID